MRGNQCGMCKHFDTAGSAGPTCPAFPDEIPLAVFFFEHDHRLPYEGDHGVRFEVGDHVPARIREWLLSRPLPGQE